MGIFIKSFIIDSFCISNNFTVSLVIFFPVISSTKLFFFKGDIRDREFLEKVFFESKEIGKPIEGVIHFAGLKAVNESISFPLKYWENNVAGTVTLLNVMEQYNCRTIVFSSSATIYGEADGKLINENSLIRPSSPYGSTKLAIEYLLNDLFSSKSNQWKIINLRYFNPIGAHPSGLIGDHPWVTLVIFSHQ